MIIDNFVEFFENPDILSLEGLQACRSESVNLATNGCLREAGFGRQETLQVDKKVRCDTLMWLTNLLTTAQHENAPSDEAAEEQKTTTENDTITQELRKLVGALDQLKLTFN